MPESLSSSIILKKVGEGSSEKPPDPFLTSARMVVLIPITTVVVVISYFIFVVLFIIGVSLVFCFGFDVYLQYCAYRKRIYK
jgi:hypothetical protein